MSYWLEKFTPTGESDYALPTRMPHSDVGGLKRRDASVDTAAGNYDAFGAEQLTIARTPLTHRGIIKATSAAALVTAKRAALKIAGKTGKLYRLWDGGTVREWVNARCLDVSAVRRIENVLHEELEFAFVALSPAWNGTVHDDDFTINASPKNITVANAGDARVLNAQITVTAGSAAITAVTLATGSAELTYSGTIAISKALVIDCGALSVKNDGAAAYADFTWTGSHTTRWWFPLASGNNTVTVTLTGGSTDSVVNFQYYDGWH